jgi:hypothetical protein
MIRAEKKSRQAETCEVRKTVSGKEKEVYVRLYSIFKILLSLTSKSNNIHKELQKKKNVIKKENHRKNEKKYKT